MSVSGFRVKGLGFEVHDGKMNLLRPLVFSTLQDISFLTFLSRTKLHHYSNECGLPFGITQNKAPNGNYRLNKGCNINFTPMLHILSFPISWMRRVYTCCWKKEYMCNLEDRCVFHLAFLASLLCVNGIGQYKILEASYRERTVLLFGYGREKKLTKNLEGWSRICCVCLSFVFETTRTSRLVMDLSWNLYVVTLPCQSRLR